MSGRPADGLEQGAHGSYFGAQNSIPPNAGTSNKILKDVTGATTLSGKMSQAMETAERFDRISDVYDETREPLTDEALDKAMAILSRDGCKLILEVGIGTGRIARPLQQRGLEIVGVDLSRRMMAKAREKGIEDLVMGDANHLPVRDKTFDAVVMAHVLHLLENPAETFGRLTRVARKEIVVFVRRRDLSSEADQSLLAGDGRGALREAFRRAAQELGCTLPSRSGDWRERFRGEVEFLNTNPPTELITIQDVSAVTTMGERLSFFEKRAYGYPPASLPEDVLQKLVERVRSSVDLKKEIHYRRVEQMAIWRLPG